MENIAQDEWNGQAGLNHFSINLTYFLQPGFFFGGGAQNKVTLQLGLNFDPVQAGENSTDPAPDLPKLDQALSHRTFSSWNQNFGQKNDQCYCAYFWKGQANSIIEKIERQLK